MSRRTLRASGTLAGRSAQAVSQWIGHARHGGDAS